MAPRFRRDFWTRSGLISQSAATPRVVAICGRTPLSALPVGTGCGTLAVGLQLVCDGRRATVVGAWVNVAAAHLARFFEITYRVHPLAPEDFTPRLLHIHRDARRSGWGAPPSETVALSRGIYDSLMILSLPRRRNLAMVGPPARHDRARQAQVTGAMSAGSAFLPPAGYVPGQRVGRVAEPHGNEW